MIINYNPEGKWSTESVKKRYWEQSVSLGGVSGFEPTPKTYTNFNGCTWVYNVMESVIDGVQLGDFTCVQLCIDYINDDVKAPTTGYTKERMARALRHASLSDKQKKELSEIFIKQLESGKIYKEYREYIRLFKIIGVTPYKEKIQKCIKGQQEFIKRAASKLLA